MICKPNSVSRKLSGWQSFIWSPNYFGAQALYPAVLRRAAHNLHELAPREVCHASECYHRSGELLPHLFTFACGKPQVVYFLWHWLTGYPDLPVRKHGTRWCSDFPPPKKLGSDCPIILKIILKNFCYKKRKDVQYRISTPYIFKILYC